MAFETKIEWVDHTFNPWIGCTRISPACDNCYAAAMSHRRGWARFETGAPRKRTTEAYWRQPILWNRKAEAAGVRRKVFGPSLADPFDAEIDDAWRHDYVDLIEKCPWLDFILLTKRPQVAVKFFAGQKVPDNLWPGVTAENQEMLELRGPKILSIDAKVHVLSAEPLLGNLRMDGLLRSKPHDPTFGWVIAGGESGPKARPSHPDWFRSLRDQCAAAHVPFFFKQWGEWAPEDAKPDHEATYQADLKAGRTWRFAATPMRKIGKKAAGALLDGREWREAP